VGWRRRRGCWRPLTRASLRDGEGERASWGRQYGVGPIAHRRAGTSPLIKYQGHEGLFLYDPHGVVSAQTLYTSHKVVKRVRKEPCLPPAMCAKTPATSPHSCCDPRLGCA